MSSIEEIKKTSDFLNKSCSNYFLLHCNSTYPAPYHDINLKFMDSLKNIHSNIGYSGHERGIAVSLAAIARGSMVLVIPVSF